MSPLHRTDPGRPGPDARAPAPDLGPHRSPDAFWRWLHAPLGATSDDPRLEVRRARPEDFEAIYDLVDEAFGRRRPRARFDWLYRRNPGGLARCWTTWERGSGKLVASMASWPWPVARGDRMVAGMLGGDAAVAPGWQRQGIPDVRRRVSHMHPERALTASFSWPNEKTQGRQHKHGRSARLRGPLPRAERRLDRAGPIWLRLADRVLALRTGLRVEPVRRFDASVDAVTWRWMGWDGFWTLHDAVFLNWRYLDHPDREYRAFALLDPRDAVCGYCVVNLDGPVARLMELAAPRERAAYRLLLARAGSAAREAGCRRMRFFATAGWPGWPLLHGEGFRERPSGRWIILHAAAKDGSDDPLARWQLLPGDDEVL